METQVAELVGQSNTLIEQAMALYAKGKEMSAEDNEQAGKITAEAMALKERAANISNLCKAAEELEAIGQKQATQAGPSGFKSLGTFLQGVYMAGVRGTHDPRLLAWNDPNEPNTTMKAGVDNVKGWSDSPQVKDLVENIGVSGGFLVPVEHMAQFLQVPGPESIVRPRATVVPMRRRQIQWPVLDQTNTTSGRPAWYGGVLARWTEEAAQKDETQPYFKQINLVAHKLVCYTEASDELLDDSAVSLEALLMSLYRGTIAWYEEDAFVNGTGAGQPRGVIWAPATFAQARAAAGAIGIVDIINMLEHFQGSNPCWLISRSALPSIMQLNGPAGNPSYVFMPSARDGMPGTLFGYPIFWNEHCPLLGSRGDIGLYDFKMYLVGDRQGTTIDASKHFRFQYDLTAWRAVHRVDGQPWLSQPIRLSDGTTQVSPFVVLDAATGS